MSTYKKSGKKGVGGKGNPNTPAAAAKKATGKTGGVNTPPKGAVPKMRMGGSKKAC